MTSNEIAKQLKEMGIRQMHINYNERIVIVEIYENRKYSTPQAAIDWMTANGFEAIERMEGATPLYKMQKVLRKMVEEEAMGW